MSLQRYRCHKTVEAMKIQLVLQSPSAYDPADEAQGGAFLFPYAPEGVVPEPIKVSAAYLAKHQPEKDGYYVRYEDGYESFSPAAAFESGYSLISEVGSGG